MHEKSKQLLASNSVTNEIGNTRAYRFRIRNGTANIFVIVEPKAGLRYTIVRKRRKKEDFSL